MDYQRQSIDIIWNKLGVDTLLFSYFKPNYSDVNLLKNRFTRYLVDCYQELTLDQASAIEGLLCQKWMNYPNSEFEDLQSGNLFNVLLHFVQNVLIEDIGEPRCKFEHLLRWWNISQLVDSNLLVCAYLADKDLHKNFNRIDFAWSPVLKHTNYELNEMLNKGISELHFHLKGSSLNFDIQWLSLMNDVSERRSIFQKYMQHAQCAVLIETQDVNKHSSMYEQMLLAAYLRMYLYKVCVKGIDEHIDKYKLDNISLCLLDLQDEINICKCGAYRYVKSTIDRGEVIDYAIPITLPIIEVETDRFVNSILHGERLILYSALRYIYGNNAECKLWSQVRFALLAYTMVKCRFRQELLQINERKGFSNFDNYERIKEIFIKSNSVYEFLIKDIALKNTCCNQPISYLEYRIAPKDNFQSLLKEFCFLAGLDKNTYFNNEEISKKMSNIEMFTITHFIKKTEKDSFHWLRNYSLRCSVKRQSCIIRRAFFSSQLVRKMICGFDAANSERNARPEVFAQAFRYLRGELYFNQNDYLKLEKPHTFGMTYHVGEDFWDIIDGLRAIDEAILFLNLQEGDRLGHALALGVSVFDYYSKRHELVVMPRQIFLDNMVWLYFKAQKYNISLPPSLLGYIDKKVKEYSRIIFGESQDKIDLYNSWLLRGDDPLTSKGNNANLGWEAYSHNNVLFELNDIRDNEKAVNLFLAYHTNKEKGDVICCEKLDKTIFDVIFKVQSKMRLDIEHKHIAIETNLTSNLRIGEFNRFDEHPILQYNRDGLGGARCPNSISVSINTDDQGIFGTSITNEFALMALAMEKLKDEEGNFIYRPSDIINWLNNIREMAITQRFVKNN